MTTGAGNDIEKATELARKMVCEWGMSEKLGPDDLRQEGGADLPRPRLHAGARTTPRAPRIEIDDEVRRIVSEGYQRAKRLLTQNLEILHADGRGAARARDASTAPTSTRSSRAAAGGNGLNIGAASA